MGGAERNARNKRRQQAAAKAVTQARGANPTRNGMVIGIVVVLVIGVAVIGGILLNQSDDEQPTGPTAAPKPTAQYEARTQPGGVIHAGSPDAPVTVDIYEDFLCPACGQLYQQSHKQLDQALASGKLQARFHMLNMLDRLSNPPGYSLEASNAASCAADAGGFQRFNASLFENQPKEGGAGYTANQLVELGKKSGISDQKFASCVRQGKYKDDVQQGFQKAKQDLTKLLGDEWGTPTVIHKGKYVDAMGNPDWVNQLVSKAD